MIRVDAHTADGRPAWVLIAQPDHASLAAQCARGWREPLLSHPSWHRELLDAIALHDDGWRDWEARPEIDLEHGRPRSFLEMPLQDSLAIWRASIATGDARGPLAGYAVAGHFSALLRKFHYWQSDPTQRAQAEAFLAEQDALQPSRARRAMSTYGGDPIAHSLDRAVRWLQFFDALSLWLCTREQPEPAEFEYPDGIVRLEVSAANELIVIPWPFKSKNVALKVRAQLVQGQRHASFDELDLAAIPISFRWRLKSGS